MLKVHSDRLGSFLLTTQVPNADLNPNCLHSLILSEKKQRPVLGFVRIETEQLIEAMQPFVNRCAQQFCSVGDPQRKMALIAQSQ